MSDNHTESRLISPELNLCVSETPSVGVAPSDSGPEALAVPGPRARAKTLVSMHNASHHITEEEIVLHLDPLQRNSGSERSHDGPATPYSHGSGSVSGSAELPAALDTPQILSVVEPAPNGINKDAIEDKDKFLRFQLIPIGESIERGSVGDVIERSIREGMIIRMGRLVSKDGIATSKSARTVKTAEIDIWYPSKVVSRLHAEMWYKDGSVLGI